MFPPRHNSLLYRQLNDLVKPAGIPSHRVCFMRSRKPQPEGIVPNAYYVWGKKLRFTDRKNRLPNRRPCFKQFDPLSENSKSLVRRIWKRAVYLLIRRLAANFE